VAEHGLSFLVSVFAGETRRTLLFDTGSSVTALTHNLRVMGATACHRSHRPEPRHFDHTTGLNGLVGTLDPSRRWSFIRCLAASPCRYPGRQPWELPTTSEEKILAAGFPVIESRAPSKWLDGAIVVTGEIERGTDFEHGLPVHEAFRDGA